MDTGIQKYRAFVETVDRGSFTAAAQALSYTQSAVSRMIADLEREWGVVLVERRHSGVTATSDGLQLLPYARRICEDQRRLASEVDSLQGLLTGTVRVGTFSSVASHRLPAILSRFSTDYPGISFELLLGDYSEVEDWLRAGRVDCGFLRLPTDDAFDTVLLEEDEIVAVVPLEHELAGDAVFPVSRLADFRYISVERSGNVVAADVLPQVGSPVKPFLVTWDDLAVLAMVESGLGISILNSMILERTSFRVATLPLDPPFKRRVAAATRKGSPPTRAASAFLHYVDLYYRCPGDGRGNEGA